MNLTLVPFLTGVAGVYDVNLSVYPVNSTVPFETFTLTVKCQPISCRRPRKSWTYTCQPRSHNYLELYGREL